MKISRLDDGRKLQFEVCPVYTQVPSKCEFISSINDEIAINSTEKSAGIVILFQAFRKESLLQYRV